MDAQQLSRCVISFHRTNIRNSNRFLAIIKEFKIGLSSRYLKIRRMHSSKGSAYFAFTPKAHLILGLNLLNMLNKFVNMVSMGKSAHSHAYLHGVN